MGNLKIGIIENDLLIAESIAVTLQQIGYRHTTPARNYAEALKMIASEKPDLLLLDIMLDGDKDGIDLAAAVNSEYGLPFIFLTANSDAATVNRAKAVKPNAYLVKPFNENDLFSSIEIAFSNFNKHDEWKEKKPVTNRPVKDFIFIKDGDLFRKIAVSDILYIESDSVYLNVHTAEKQFVIRAKQEDFINDFPNANLIKVHKSYAINLKHLNTINTSSVIVGNKEIPMLKNYRQSVLNAVTSI